MNPFFLTTAIIPRFCYVILFAVAVAYLLSRKHKSAATWWLAAFCAFLAIDDIGWELYSVVPLTRMSPVLHDLIYIIGQGLIIPVGLSFTQFAYTFRGNPYPREARIVLGIGVALTVLALLVIFLTPSYVFSPRLMQVQLGVLGVMVTSGIWAGVVFLRKTLHFSRGASTEPAASTARDHLRAPRGRSARACRTFVGLSLLFVLFTVGGVLAWGLMIFTELGVFIFDTTYLIFLYGLLVAYVTYAPEPTTVQVKLVGASLVTVLMIFVVLPRLLFPEADMLAASGLSTPPPHTLHFAPNDQGGYTAAAAPPRWDPAFGDTLALANDAYAAVPLPFRFPFYGDEQRTLYISDNGLVALEPPAHGNLEMTSWALFHTFPFIAPLGNDLDPTQGGAVFFKASEEAATVTWHEVPLHDGADRYSAQLVLYSTGAVDIHYVMPEATPVARIQLRLGLRGLYPGGVDAPRLALPPQPAGVLQGGAGVALVEDYMMQYFRYQEEQGRLLFWIVVGATLFILFVLPYVFRYSLLRPLDRLLAGVRQVEAGRHDVAVPVEAEDEIGTLTQHFNEMTRAIHKAEAALQTYAETLEDQVEARTAALQQSLDELKSTQARLVQQEKMASLGGLTAGIAHEIKNPLNFVNNFASLSRELVDELEEETDPEEIRALLADLKKNAEKIEAHGKRADGIVRAMLEHSRGSSSERRAVDLNKLVEEYAGLAYHGKRARQADFEAKIVEELDEGVGAVEVVPQELGRVLLNLIGNAFDAVQERAASVNGQFTPTVIVATRRVGDQVEIRVEDNGPGIADGVKARIFEPFFTTKPTGSGTGLGLSLSYDIVTQGHGGTLAVESEEGEGTTFVVRLPQAHVARS